MEKRCFCFNEISFFRIWGSSWDLLLSCWIWSKSWSPSKKTSQFILRKCFGELLNARTYYQRIKFHGVW